MHKSAHFKPVMKDVPTEQLRKRVHALVDKDLRYVLELANRFDSPEMQLTKETVNYWLELDPSVPLEEESHDESDSVDIGDGSDDEENDHMRDSNGALGKTMPNIVPFDD